MLYFKIAKRMEMELSCFMHVLPSFVLRYSILYSAWYPSRAIVPTFSVLLYFAWWECADSHYIVYRIDYAAVLRTWSAASGHGQNQSMVLQFTKAGNCLIRARKISPIGLQVENDIQGKLLNYPPLSLKNYRSWPLRNYQPIVLGNNRLLLFKNYRKLSTVTP